MDKRKWIIISSISLVIILFGICYFNNNINNSINSQFKDMVQGIRGIKLLGGSESPSSEPFNLTQNLYKGNVQTIGTGVYNNAKALLSNYSKPIYLISDDPNIDENMSGVYIDAFNWTAIEIDTGIDWDIWIKDTNGNRVSPYKYYKYNNKRIALFNITNDYVDELHVGYD